MVSPELCPRTPNSELVVSRTLNSWCPPNSELMVSPELYGVPGTLVSPEPVVSPEPPEPN